MVNVVAFAFLVLHTVTWFVAHPAGDGRCASRGRRVPAVAIIGAQYVGLAVVSAFIYWLVTDEAPRSKFRGSSRFVWLTFSGGGVMAAMFLPVLAFLFALAFPLGWIDPPDHDHLPPSSATRSRSSCCSGMFVLMLVHAAHRFRYTLYDGLQVKHKVLVGAACYGGALLGTLLALDMLGSAT